MSYNLEIRLRDFLLEGFEKRTLEGSWEQLLKEEKAKWYPQICRPSDCMTLFFLIGLDSIRQHFIFWSLNACVCPHATWRKHAREIKREHWPLCPVNMFLCVSSGERFQISSLMWWEVLNWKTLISSFQIDSSLVGHLRAREEILMVTLAVFPWPPTCLTF